MQLNQATDKGTISVVIPTFNEGESIEYVLNELLAYSRKHPIKVIVVDDGSTDHTQDILNRITNSNPTFPLHIITHSQNRGYGGAIKSGISAVDTDYVVTIDADGQHNLHDIEGLKLKMLDEKADMCIGNRNFKGSTFYRNIIKKLVLYIVRKSTGININDLNSGMKFYKTTIVQSLLKYAPNGMPFSDTIVLLHHQFRYKITEADIIIRSRENGKSTINYKTAIYTLVEVANIIINFFPFRFFLYIAFSLFMLSLVWGLPFIMAGHGMSTGMSFLLLASLNFIFFGILLENVVRSRFEDYHYNTQIRKPRDAKEHP
ncbi:MAG: hypothetical protein RIQ62_614 [Bacteroidota bacterium]|jgi:glycosyltransferase involved in cell wall biosynthesis